MARLMVSKVDERCYNCGKKIPAGEEYAVVMARPQRLQDLKAHYFFAVVHQPRCQTNLKNRHWSTV